VRFGLIARADDRGLGNICWEVYRHLRPDRTLVVREPGAERAGFAPHLDRYPDGVVVSFDDGHLCEETVREWLAGLDVVYSAETFYEPLLARWAADAGVATVLHVMPEFFRPDTGATVLWAPTPWRLDRLPADTRLVPVPVADDRFAFAVPEPAARLRVLHVAGRRAMADRNGTDVFAAALNRSRAALDVTITGQDGRLPRVRQRANLAGRSVASGHADYWAAYASADLLVMPRRYGGLSLPVQEAMAAGLAVAMTDVEPQSSTWPIIPVPTLGAPGRIRTAAGDIDCHVPDDRALARIIDALAADRARVVMAQEASVRWAEAHRWSALRRLWVDELERACAGRVRV
jgi:glycosyltransferase involved in cell wall biosynthesis